MPNCPVLVQHGRCPAHSRQGDRLRGSASQRGYDHRWHLVSEALRRAHPVCGMRHDDTMDTVNSQCARLGLTVMAQCTDHTIPKAQGGTDDETNLMSACWACNNARAQR